MVSPRHTGDRHPERGSSAVEVAIVMPVVMLLLLVVVQAGIYFHTQAVATTAARKGVDVARQSGGSGAEGTQVATEFLDQSAGGLSDRAVAVTRTGGVAEATVSGRVASVLFGVPFHVTVVVTAPVERVTP